MSGNRSEFDVRLESVHAEQIERVQERLAARDSFRFAVVGKINNSIGVFERQIVPMLNASGAAFLVSVGDAVSDETSFPHFVMVTVGVDEVSAPESVAVAATPTSALPMNLAP